MTKNSSNTLPCIIIFILLSVLWFGVMTRRFILFDPAFEVVHPSSYTLSNTFGVNDTKYTDISNVLSLEPVQTCFIASSIASIDPTHTNVTVVMNVTLSNSECGYVLYSSVRHFNEVRLLFSMLTILGVLVGCVCVVATKHLHRPISSATDDDLDEFKVQDLDRMSDEEDTSKAKGLSSLPEEDEEEEEAKFDREMSEALA